MRIILPITSEKSQKRKYEMIHSLPYRIRQKNKQQRELNYLVRTSITIKLSLFFLYFIYLCCYRNKVILNHFKKNQQGNKSIILPAYQPPPRRSHISASKMGYIISHIGHTRRASGKKELTSCQNLHHDKIISILSYTSFNYIVIK